MPIVKKGRGRPAKVYRLRAPDGNLHEGTDGNLLPLNMPSSKSTEKGTAASREQVEMEPKGVVMADPLSGDGVVQKHKTSIAEKKQAPDSNLIDDEEGSKAVKEVEGAVALSSMDPVVAPSQTIAIDKERRSVSLPADDNISEKQTLICSTITKDMIPDLPVFTSEEEKIAFEETLNQIDMTQVSERGDLLSQSTTGSLRIILTYFLVVILKLVSYFHYCRIAEFMYYYMILIVIALFSLKCDNLFSVHAIQQDINENSPVNISRVSSELNVYTCTVCDKVFKMLSHVRNHVLGHTDLKPFACRLCEYASNNKGNGKDCQCHILLTMKSQILKF